VRKSLTEINALLESPQYQEIMEKISRATNFVLNGPELAAGSAIIGGKEKGPEICFAIVVYPGAPGPQRVLFTTSDLDVQHAAAVFRLQAMQLDGRRFADVVEQAARKLCEMNDCYAPDDIIEHTEMTIGGGQYFGFEGKPAWRAWEDEARAVLLVALGVEPAEEPAKLDGA